MYKEKWFILDHSSGPSHGEGKTAGLEVVTWRPLCGKSDDCIRGGLALILYLSLSPSLLSLLSSKDDSIVSPHLALILKLPGLNPEAHLPFPSHLSKALVFVLIPPSGARAAEMADCI